MAGNEAKAPPVLDPCTPITNMAYCFKAGRDCLSEIMKEEIVQKLRARLEKAEHAQAQLKEMQGELHGMMYMVSPKVVWPAVFPHMARPRSVQDSMGIVVSMHLLCSVQDGTFMGAPFLAQTWIKIEMRKLGEHWMMVSTDSLANVPGICIITVKHMGSDEYVPVNMKNKNPSLSDWWDGAQWHYHEDRTIFNNGDLLNIEIRDYHGVLHPLSWMLSATEHLCYFPIRIVE